MMVLKQMAPLIPTGMWFVGDVSLVLALFLQTCGRPGGWLCAPGEQPASGVGGVGREGLEEETPGHWHPCGGLAMRPRNVFSST